MCNIEELQNKKHYIFLDFGGKLSSQVFEKQVFVRIANLKCKNPIVQVNDSVFKGTFDHAVGTNLFFEETDNSSLQSDAFVNNAPINLKHVNSGTKIVNLKLVKVAPKKANIPNKNQKIHLNLDWDYDELLEKFADGTLTIDSILAEESENVDDSVQVSSPLKVNEAVQNDVQSEEMEVEEQQALQENLIDTANQIEEQVSDNNAAIRILEDDYERLKILASRPTRRIQSPELVEECTPKYKHAYEYHNLERQILQPSFAFKTETISEIDETGLSNCVDIDRCILYGLLSPSDERPRRLSKQEMEKVLTLDNFDNLSLAGRYYVLNKQVEDLEGYLKNVSESELTKDKFNRTPRDTLEIYRKLRNALKQRIGEIKYSLDSDIMEINDSISKLN